MSRTSILAAALLLVLQGTQVAAQSICKPAVTIKNVGFSEVVNLRRFWTATVHVDASQCTSKSGLYSLGFVRTAEHGLNLTFARPFIWQPGQTSIRVEFWADEAVDEYWIGEVATCPCRAD
jgi:hypothetical protein